MSQGKQQPQHQPAGGPAFWNITHNLKPGELESDMIKMLYSTGIDLQKENEALKARIKRLEEAAEAISKTRSCGCPYGESVFYCRTCVSAWDAWEDAKEAKP
jgi:hypothetical protein